MYYFAVGFGAWLHVFFWGAGLAWLTMPRPWRRFWPVMVWPAGLALQSVAVWLGAHAGWAGTDQYAWWSEVVPAVLLAIAVRGNVRVAVRDLARFGGLWALMATTLAVWMGVLARAAKGLTTISLGSFDAADYAAGARVFKEFAYGDRTGFLGLTEVVRVMSVDNVFDFWLRLNHFTPSALVALNGTILDCQPHELISVLTAVLLVSSLPVVFWCARAVLGYRPAVALWVTALYGFGPVTWYAVGHVAIGQLLAAPAIGVITWAGVALWRGRMSVRRGAMFFGLVAIGYGLILGSYNFIVIVCLAPAAAFAGGLAAWRGEWRKLTGWFAVMLVPLMVAGVLFWTRVAGLLERFLLFRQYDFGWRVPTLTPEGWLGLVGDIQLHAMIGVVRGGLLAAAAVGLIAALLSAGLRRKRAVYAAVCLAVPPLVGYAFLCWRGMQLGTNASYDAYKVLAVFYPGLLPAIAFWAAWGWTRRGWVRAVVIVAMLAVLGGNLRVATLFASRLVSPPFGVTRDVIDLRRLERDPQIESLNLRLTDGWSRLWANAQLLRVPQYFDIHTYEGRLNTPLRGRWDLIGGVIEIVLPDGESRRIGRQFSLLDTRSQFFFRAWLGAGWNDIELPFGLPEQWCWSRRAAAVQLENLQSHSLTVDLRLKVRALAPCEMQVWLGDRHCGTVQVGTEASLVNIRGVVIPTGSTALEFRIGGVAAKATDDSRELGVAFYTIGFDVRGMTNARLPEGEKERLRKEAPVWR